MLKKIIKKANNIKWRLQNLKLINQAELYALWEQQQLTRFINEYQIDCIFDVGANKGQYATMLRQKCGFKGLIISFEPMPDAAAIIRKNSENDPNWVVVEMALSDQEGETTFNLMSSHQFSSLGTPAHNETDIFENNNKIKETIKVKTNTLNNVFAQLQQEYQFKKPFLKLDTQGYDVLIIENGREVIQSFEGLQSELAVKKIYAESVYFCDAIKFYESLGFTLSAFVPNNVGHFPRLIETDCLMVNNKHLR